MSFCARISLFLGALALAACGTSSLRNLQAISQSDIYKVIAEVKWQISVYSAYQHSPLGYASVQSNSRTKVCGNGMIAFDIVSAKMELLSTSDSTQGANVALGPFPAGGIAVGGSFGGSHTLSDVQQLVLVEDVSRSSRPVVFEPWMLKEAPLANAMINLWKAALQSGDDDSDICLRLKKGASDGNTYKMAITITKTVNGKVNVGLAGIGLSGSGDFKSLTGNSVIVKFEPHDFSKPPAPPAKECPSGDPSCAEHFRNMQRAG
jgi:hypothetical protein